MPIWRLTFQVTAKLLQIINKTFDPPPQVVSNLSITSWQCMSFKSLDVESITCMHGCPEVLTTIQSLQGQTNLCKFSSISSTGSDLNQSSLKFPIQITRLVMAMRSCCTSDIQNHYKRVQRSFVLFFSLGYVLKPYMHVMP